MKRKTAKEILADSFRELTERNPANKITVKDITENCGYSTATFYRQFRDKYDLIAWDYSRRYKDILDRMDPADWKKIFLDSALHFNGQKEYLANLMLHTNGFDSFVQNMKMLHLKYLRKYLLMLSGADRLPVQQEMSLRLYCYGATELACDWILGKFDASPEDLADAYENSLPLPIRQLFDEKMR